MLYRVRQREHDFQRSRNKSHTDIVLDGEVGLGHQQHRLAVECVVGELEEVPTLVQVHHHCGEAQLQLVQLGSDTNHQGKLHLQHDGGDAELVQLEGQLEGQLVLQ